MHMIYSSSECPRDLAQSFYDAGKTSKFGDSSIGSLRSQHEPTHPLLANAETSLPLARLS
jgi:hypothetical protein